MQKREEGFNEWISNNEWNDSLFDTPSSSRVVVYRKKPRPVQNATRRASTTRRSGATRNNANIALLQSLLDNPLPSKKQTQSTRQAQTAVPMNEEFQSETFRPFREMRSAIQEEKDAWRSIGGKAQQIKRVPTWKNQIDLGARIIEDIGKTRTAQLARKPLAFAGRQWNKLPPKAKLAAKAAITLYLLGKAAQTVDSAFKYAPRAKPKSESQSNPNIHKKHGMMQKRNNAVASHLKNKYF